MLKKEVYVNVIILGLCFFMLYMINQLPQPKSTVELGPGFFPKLIIYLIIFLSALQIIVLFFTKKEAPDESQEVSNWKVIAMIVSMVAYVASLSFFDYKIGTFLFIPAVMVLLGVKKYKVLFLVSSISTASIFLLFEVLLNVPLN